MMERLTNIGSNEEIWITDNDETRRFGRKESAYKKLAEYEDLDEQGLLLQLPLRIGTDIYFIPSEINFKLNIINNHKEDNRVYHQKVKRIIFNEFGWSFECDKDIEYELGRIFIDKTYQKTWFLTYKEAYQKLNEMEGGIYEKID